MPSGTPNWHPKIPKCPPSPPPGVGRNRRIESWILYAFRSVFSCEIKTKSYYVVLLTLHSQWYLETVCAKWLFLLSEKQMFSRSEARLWVKLYRTMFVRRYVVCYILCFINDVAHTSEILRRNFRLNSLWYNKRFRYYNFINESQFSSWPTAQDFFLFFQFSHEN